MARKKLNPVDRIRARHERRLKNLQRKKLSLQKEYEAAVSSVDTELVETKAVLAQLSK